MAKEDDDLRSRLVAYGSMQGTTNRIAEQIVSLHRDFSRHSTVSNRLSILPPDLVFSIVPARKALEKYFDAVVGDASAQKTVDLENDAVLAMVRAADEILNNSNNALIRRHAVFTTLFGGPDSLARYEDMNQISETLKTLDGRVSSWTKKKDGSKKNIEFQEFFDIIAVVQRMIHALDKVEDKLTPYYLGSHSSTTTTQRWMIFCAACVVLALLGLWL